MKAYANSIAQVAEAQSVDLETGLSAKEVKKRRERFGANKLPAKREVSPIWLFLKQFKDFLILILFLAAAISWYAGQMANVYIILGVILFNALMGFVQEYRAEKAVEAIKEMVKHEARVLRAGQKRTVQAPEIVPGDVLLLEEGQTVPADARLFEIKNLRTKEASLTGESEPVPKKTKTLEEDTELGDRRNLVFKGTHVVQGAGRAVVTATGEETEIGKIARSLGEVEKEKSNFQRKTDRLARKMAGIAIATSTIVFAIGYFYRELEFQEILLVTIATLVSSIPEGLPVVISIVLAIGANRMAKRNAIIREFTATEVLGSVSTILTDKTGTITQSILTVKRLFSGDRKERTVTGQGFNLEGEIEEEGEPVTLTENHEPLKKLLAVAAYCNDATIERVAKEAEDAGSEEEEKEAAREKPNVKVSGDPTEIALRVLGEKSGIRNLHPFDGVEVLDDIPFSSRKRFRAALLRYPEGRRELTVAGAPEKILELSKAVYREEGPAELGKEERKAIARKNEEWADDALRVIGLAHKELPEDRDEISKKDVTGLVWTGIVGIIDPPRPEVSQAVADCRRAGIRVVMVTGDHRRTAAAISEQVGILRPGENGQDAPDVLSENDIAELDDDALEEKARRVSVFARLSPNAKLRIARRLQDAGELIGMTGDGVNDAPALKKADVGIAMGQRGTDVAKDAAQVVLSDDNFASIVNAIREGRIVFKNVKSTSYFLLTTNFASTTTLIAALLLGMPIPLTAVQILWVNMVTDGIMDVAKSTEPGHGGMMDRPPIKKDEPILKWEVMPFLLIMAAIMVTLTVLTFNYYLPQGVETARTGAFFIIAMTQVFNVYNMRDLDQSVFRIGFFSNKWINIAFAASVVLQLLVVNVPFLQRMFGFGQIAMVDFVVITLLSTAVLWAGEAYKWVRMGGSKSQKSKPACR